MVPSHGRRGGPDIPPPHHRAGTPALLTLLTLLASVLAASSPVLAGTPGATATVHVANAPPEVADAGIDIAPNGSATAWVVVQDANGARDIDTVTFLAGLEEVPGVQVERNGSSVRFEAHLHPPPGGEGAAVRVQDRGGAAALHAIGPTPDPATVTLAGPAELGTRSVNALGLLAAATVLLGVARARRRPR